MQQSDTGLYALLEPGVEALGFELVMVELVGRGANSILRVYIDGPNGVTVADCADVSYQLSAVLEMEDPIPGQYTLEVSSPGLDRPLTKRGHFEKVVGRMVKLRLYRPIAGRRKFSGRLCKVQGENILVEVDGKVYEMPLIEIERARLIPEL